VNSSFWISLIGHVLLGGIFFITLPKFNAPTNLSENVPIFIDLKNVEISENTNLPAKIKKETVVRKTPKQEVKKKTNVVKKHVEVPVKKVQEIKPVQKVEKKADVAVVEKKEEKKVLSVKPKVKPVPKKPEVSAPVKSVKVPSKPVNDEPSLDSLLASVEKIKPSSSVSKSSEKDELADLLEGSLNGIKGGKTKPLSNKLSVSQLDFIQTAVRQHWMRPDDGDLDLKIEVRVSLDREGNVLDVEFLDKKFYNATGRLKSNAESTIRAVYICDKLGKDSPFRILALKNPQTYFQWKQIDLNFDFRDEGNR